MASDTSVQCQDTTSTSDYQQQQAQYLCDLGDEHATPQQPEFSQIDQQQQLYEGHQLHCKSFGDTQIACNCYQSGSEHVCSRCQTNAKQNSSGAFIYQTLPTNLDAQSGESRAQDHQQPQGIGIGEPHQSSSDYLQSSSSCDRKLHSDDYQEPLYGNDIKYYMKQDEHSTEPSSYDSSNLISVNLVRCQTTCSFDNSSSNIIVSGSPLFYQCSSNNNNNNETSWQASGDTISSFSPPIQSKSSFSGCNIVDSNNNTTDTTLHQQQPAVYPTAQYTAIPQNSPEIEELDCQQQQRQLDYYHSYDDGSQHFTSSAYQQLQYTESYHQQQQLSNESLDRDEPHSSQSSSLPVPVQDQQHMAPYQPAPSIIKRQNKPSIGAKTRRLKNPVAQSKVNGKLWEFIRDLLLSDQTNPAFIRWERREDGVFKFVQSNKVAKMWGERKQNPKMTYEKLSRAMRYYYKSKVLLPVFGRRLVYKFGPNASGWS